MDTQTKSRKGTFTQPVKSSSGTAAMSLREIGRH